MKKLILISTILWVFLTACESLTDTPPFRKLLVSINYVYSVNSTVSEASIIFSQNPVNTDEMGIVWATKNNPTTSDNRQTTTRANNVKDYPIKLDKLTQGTTYYVRAYYIFQGVTTYSTDEIAFVQNYDPNWINIVPPIIDEDHYILSSGGALLGSNGGIIFYYVNRNTNYYKNVFFYPGIDTWDLQSSNRDPTLEYPTRFEQFKANFNSGTVNATLIVGGYYKQTNGEKFFLKDSYIAGLNISASSYPGIDAPTSAFGVFGNGYVLENANNGRLWKYNMQSFKWEVMNTAPIVKNAKFVSFDIGERAFILPESSNWDDDLDALYEYLPTNNQWKKLATFKGENRRRGLSFVYNGKLYYGAGQSAKTLKGLRDIWEYDPATNIWKQVFTYAGSGTVNLITIMSGKILYIGFGHQAVISEFKGESFSEVKDFWRFTIR